MVGSQDRGTSSSDLSRNWSRHSPLGDVPEGGEASPECVPEPESSPESASEPQPPELQSSVVHSPVLQPLEPSSQPWSTLPASHPRCNWVMCTRSTTAGSRRGSVSGALTCLLLYSRGPGWALLSSCSCIQWGPAPPDIWSPSLLSARPSTKKIPGHWPERSLFLRC